MFILTDRNFVSVLIASDPTYETYEAYGFGDVATGLICGE